MLEAYRKLTAADWMELGRELHEVKQKTLASYSPKDTLAARCAGARVFYDLARIRYQINEATARHLVRIYERFGKSELRGSLERAFTSGDLSILAARTDDEVAYALKLKMAKPHLRREELRDHLKLLSGQDVLDYGH